jgi:general stress protein 26
MAALSGSRQAEQIRQNPQGQLMFQTPDCHTVATLTGTCEIVDDLERKRRVWEAMPGLRHYASGPGDEALGVIRFTARSVELILLDEYGTTPLTAEV